MFQMPICLDVFSSVTIYTSHIRVCICIRVSVSIDTNEGKSNRQPAALLSSAHTRAISLGDGGASRSPVASPNPSPSPTTGEVEEVVLLCCLPASNQSAIPRARFNSANVPHATRPPGAAAPVYNISTRPLKAMIG